MARTRRCAVLILLACVFLEMFFGCESKKELTDKTEKSVLAFIEASNGLPSTGQWRQNLAFQDMNGDGHLDILAAPRRLPPPEENKPAIWYGNGKGEWSTANYLNLPPQYPCNYGSIAAADFDGDGVPDVALAMHGIGLKALKGPTDGKYVDFSKGFPSSGDFSTRALISADFNNDGLQEVVAVSEFVQKKTLYTYGGLMMCSSDQQQWRCEKIGDPKETAGLLSDQLAVGDVNGDGNKDLAVASREHKRDLIIWLGDGKGGWTFFNKGLPQEMHYLSVCLADMDGDGRDDLIASISGIGESFKGLKVFLSRPDGFVDMSDGLPSGDSWSYFCAAGDVNGDGSKEVIAATKEGGLKIYGKKGSKWEELKISGLPETGLYRIYGLYCVDFNKDGRDDIAVIHSNAQEQTGGIQVFLSESGKN